MAEYDFDTEEIQYFLLSDEIRGLQIAMDDGQANYIYVRGEGFVEDPILLDYVWPNSPKYGMAKNLTKDEADAYIAMCEEGNLGELVFEQIKEGNLKMGDPFHNDTKVPEEQSKDTDNDLSMDEMYKRLKGMW